MRSSVRSSDEREREGSLHRDKYLLPLFTSLQSTRAGSVDTCSPLKLTRDDGQWMLIHFCHFHFDHYPACMIKPLFMPGYDRDEYVTTKSK